MDLASRTRATRFTVHFQMTEGSSNGTCSVPHPMNGLTPIYVSVKKEAGQLFASALPRSGLSRRPLITEY